MERANANSQRVRKSTPDTINNKIDKKTINNIRYYSKRNALIGQRLDELESEWDIEQMLELNAAVIALAGSLLSSQSKKWLILPGIVTAFLAQHALQGWCPPLPLFRKMGFRTRAEIEREKYALKALRGDFDDTYDAADAWRAVKS